MSLSSRPMRWNTCNATYRYVSLLASKGLDAEEALNVEWAASSTSLRLKSWPVRTYPPEVVGGLGGAIAEGGGLLAGQVGAGQVALLGAVLGALGVLAA